MTDVSTPSPMDPATLGFDLPPEFLEDLRAGKSPRQEMFLDQYAKLDWTAPWDIGKAQDALVRAEKEGLFNSQVLDVGCGLGDNAIYLATRGYQVTAVDFSQHALDKAAKRAEAAGVKEGLHFKQVDMLKPDAGLGDATWDSVLDSALLHCFDPEQRKQYLANLSRHVKTRGRLVLFCTSDANKDPWIGPNRLDQQELREHFQEKNGWKLEQLSAEVYDANMPAKPQLLIWRAVAIRV